MRACLVVFFHCWITVAHLARCTQAISRADDEWGLSHMTWVTCPFSISLSSLPYLP